MRRTKKLNIIGMFILIIALALTACGNEDEETPATEESMDMDSDMDMNSDAVTTGVEITHGDLLIKDVWGRPNFEGSNGVVYLTLVNNGEESDQLTGIQTGVAKMAQLHTSKMEDDIMKMQPVEGDLEIPAGETVSIAPGNPEGYHIMLMELNQDLSAGDSFSITLAFEKAGEITVDVEVLQP